MMLAILRNFTAVESLGAYVCCEARASQWRASTPAEWPMDYLQHRLYLWDCTIKMEVNKKVSVKYNVTKHVLFIIAYIMYRDGDDRRCDEIPSELSTCGR